MPALPEPTDIDRENSATRSAIAEKAAAAYNRVMLYAISVYGQGWTPSGVHYLASKVDEEHHRRTGEPTVRAAEVFAVRNSAGERRHFVIGKDGQAKRVSGYEEGFGPMLLEPDLERTIEVRGQAVHPHRYSLNWAGFEIYEPRTATELAELRVSRERGKAKREQEAFERDSPLIAWSERQKGDEGRER